MMNLDTYGEYDDDSYDDNYSGDDDDYSGDDDDDEYDDDQYDDDYSGDDGDDYGILLTSGQR